MQRIENQTESRAYKLFTRSISSPFTLKNYMYGLTQFCNYTSLNYDEILKLDIEDLQIRLENWVMELADRGLRRSSILAHLNGVEKFLDINRKLFYRKPLHALIKQDKNLGGGGLPYTNKDIQLMLESTKSKREIALIHFFASTGSRPQALEDPILRMKHLEEIPDTGCYAIRIYDNTKEGYWAFLTPEASDALKKYIKERKFNHETITLESPIFASVEKTAINPHLTVNSSYQLLHKILRKSGISREKVGNRFDKAMVYGFRKRFNTILKINNEINSNIAEKLMAHKKGLDGRYLTPTREECFAEFKKAVVDLTIDDSHRKSIRIEELENKDSEVKNLKEQFQLDHELVVQLFHTIKDLKAFFKDVSVKQNNDVNNKSPAYDQRLLELTENL
ncbi:MAG: site-specific integrase [Thaumarchaeota archaeon]|nr:site-specific integrase [Nitrososphaerota archaeon]